jgi:RNA polymerase sigma factor (sigma-70 family)
MTEGQALLCYTAGLVHPRYQPEETLMQAPPLPSSASIPSTQERRWRRKTTSPSLYLVVQERVEQLIPRARAGEHVREEILLAFQPLLVALAKRFLISLQQRGQVMVEVDDLLQSANMALLLAFDTALKRDDPYLYLLQAVRYTLNDYTRGHASTYSQCETLPTISLDKPLTEDGITLADLLAAPEERAKDTENAHQARREHQYSLLHQAIASLPEKQRLVIERHYGFSGQAEPLNMLNEALSRKSHVAYYHHQKALAQLRRLLTSVFPEFVDDTVPVDQRQKEGSFRHV